MTFANALQAYQKGKTGIIKLPNRKLCAVGKSLADVFFKSYHLNEKVLKILSIFRSFSN
jgi:hypothetical protein